MYEGTNQVAIQSRQWIVNALLGLLQEKDYHQISIKEIVRRADLSRQTFYNIFNSKDDVIRFCLHQGYLKMKDRLLAKVQANHIMTPADITDCFSLFFEENHDLVQKFLDQHLDYIIAAEVTEDMNEFLELVSPDTVHDRTYAYGNAFLSGAMTQIMLHWFKDPDPLSKEELSTFLLKILGGNYYAI